MHFMFRAMLDVGIERAGGQGLWIGESTCIRIRRSWWAGR